MRRALRRAANPAVARVLRSRLHPLLSGRLLLLTYRGPRSGRRYTLPLLYARTRDGLLLVALHPAGQTWWRHSDGAEVEVLLAGTLRRGRASVVGDTAAARHAFAAARPWARPVLRRARDATFVAVGLG